MLATRASNSYFTLLLCPWPHFQSSPLLYVGREAIQQLVLWSNSITSQSQGFNSGNNSWQSFRNIIECLLNQGYCCIQLEVGKVFVIWISGISTIHGCLSNAFCYTFHQNVFQYAQLQLHLSVSAMEMFAWWVELTVTRGEWRCVSMGCGELWATVDGTQERPLWCANSLGTRTQVSETLYSVSELCLAC